MFTFAAVEGFRVSELAERAGVAPSTVRFYERAGLLSPARRAPNGYRVFEESALDELAFIGWAKGIGMSLEDIASLVAAWPGRECRSLQARLRGFLAGRIRQVREQLAELGAFERQLQAVLGRLSARDPGPERCGKGCGCEADLDVTLGGADPGPRPWGCTLGRDALGSRIGQWRAVADAAISAERASESVRLVLPAGPDMIATVAALCAAETACCAQTRFLLEVRPGDPDRGGSGHPGPARHAVPGQRARRPVSITAAAFAMLVWVASRALAAAVSRVPAAPGRPREYLAGRTDGVRITAVVACGDELLVSLAAADGGDLLAGVFCVTAGACSPDPVVRWRDEGTPLRGYVSADGAVMLADPVLGGDAACEPTITVT